MGKAARMFFWMTILTGILYPLLITLIAQLTMQHKAEGSFISFENKRIGSELIAQKFENEKYFWARPSFHDYNPLESGGSNYGPTSKSLKAAVAERKQKMGRDKKQIPQELLFSSGSGLDPHISVSSAYFQMERIARARKKQTKEIKELVDKMSVRRVFGEPLVNVLLLNKALDEVHHAK